MSAVLFDVDGTLVDSVYLHTCAWSRAFSEAGHPVDAWRVHRSIGMGGSQLLENLVGEKLAAEIGDRVQDRHTELYLAESALLRPFARARELVSALAGRGARVVLATSAAPEEASRLREVLKLDDVVTAITTGEDVDTAKPDPELVEVALDRAGVPAGEAIFVGDAMWDVIAAKKVGVPTIGLCCGGTGEAELREAGAVAVYQDPADLFRNLDDSPLAGYLSV
ncbi:haloacid dehalogenase superfamily, subfamily IA, variant 3 with third motif having DD or ED/haloacid dehalogenase superfamily, subfamily IA, variant 1 with third motif having Dx(3-4)D or Dx(3-4)E [Amycolatopsis xylanica]|uniref:Haloacid dehalogenase superfamily, subfamily IA, variant 3 with third motif having DD or ED/haloacid dehalogenase superfamily, subfamily IA, variant 1 with third motif having Dx(3-4)D or Dx(3-4)E n=1 Tax=Amycolatopsis xylanica TaxID=589385 RepID=A0A1H2UL76_9PSEU|nr:HAD family hydrolase [Amycolatopsis xylanica]SDW56872.1 haloacid dehalogenase superfamily, subfamily IA, variant 3 with third motif having DD or ED/haloacid dehalogenase superfamily, subfamily IA, variant 1 with third motif having Dx(3-4)D or Dx(3-4)E [Amycolatopsis xylanica]